MTETPEPITLVGFLIAGSAPPRSPAVRRSNREPDHQWYVLSRRAKKRPFQHVKSIHEASPADGMIVAAWQGEVPGRAVRVVPGGGGDCPVFQTVRGGT